jgi:uncharacterized repeat protein (TIGR03803 family)
MKYLKNILFVIFSLYFGIGQSKAQYNIILNFNDTAGRSPVSDLAGSDSILYGMTPFGGAGGYGTIFSVFTDGTGYKDLYDFKGKFGEYPKGSLTRSPSDSLLFGMTEQGGTDSVGTIFSIKANGTGFKNVFNFNGVNGQFPVGSLILSDNVLYGMTVAGGANFDGNIFSINTNGSNFKDLFDFNYFNGELPNGSLTLSGNELYGMTSAGGADGLGCIFSVQTDGSGYQDLFDFNGTDGENPEGSLILSGNELYGMTSAGGADSLGCIFSIQTNGGNFLKLLDFNISNGANPEGSLTLSGNILYGMCETGGADNGGNIFSFNISDNIYMDLFDFNGSNGSNPSGTLIISRDTLYGMTALGGSLGFGVVFAFSPPVPTSIKEFALDSGNMSIFPNPGASLIHCVVTSNDPVQANLEIIDMLGRRLSGAPVHLVQGTNTFSRDVSGFNAGIYFFRLSTLSGTNIQKEFVIK